MFPMREQAMSPVMSQGGNTEAITSEDDGATYVAFPSQVCSQLTIVNDTGAAIEWIQDGQEGVPLPVGDGATFTIFGVDNASRISVRRMDNESTPVHVKARWEY